MKLPHSKPILSLALITLTMYVSSCSRHKPWEVAVADYIVNERLTSNIDSAEINMVADTLLHNTEWKGKTKINKPYDAKAINVYVIDGKAAYIRENDQFIKLMANCAYAGSNIIFLDDAYLQSFLDSHHVIKDPQNPELINDQQSLLYWAIGHRLVI